MAGPTQEYGRYLSEKLYREMHETEYDWRTQEWRSPRDKNNPLGLGYFLTAEEEHRAWLTATKNGRVKLSQDAYDAAVRAMRHEAFKQSTSQRPNPKFVWNDTTSEVSRQDVENARDRLSENKTLRNIANVEFDESWSERFKLKEALLPLPPAISPSQRRHLNSAGRGGGKTKLDPKTSTAYQTLRRETDDWLRGIVLPTRRTA